MSKKEVPSYHVPNEVIQSASNGNSEAQALIWDRTNQPIFAHSILKTNSLADAEDVRSEVYLKMMLKLSTYQDMGRPLIAWLFAIANKEAINNTRKIRKNVSFENTIMHTQQSEKISPEEYVMEIETRKEVREAVSKLPEEQKRVIELRYYAGLSVSDTAQQLNKRVGNVKALQYYGVSNLRKQLAKLA